MKNYLLNVLKRFPKNNLDVKLFGHLLPKGEAWRLAHGKTLTKYIDGIYNGFYQPFINYVGQMYLDNFAQTTSKLSELEAQKGLPLSSNLTEQQRRDRLEGRLKAFGGQSPYYIQKTLQDAGFNIYIHEWWIPGTKNPRNPIALLGTSGGNVYKHSFGNVNKQFGDVGVQFGGILTKAGTVLINKPQPDTMIPTDEKYWPYFIYFGAKEFPEQAVIDPARKDELEQLLLTICPAHLWIGLFAYYGTAPINFLLLEDGGELLLEDGGQIGLES